MRFIHYYLLASALFTLTACNKDTPDNPGKTDSYTDMAHFHEVNGVAAEIFTFDAGTGGTFISAKGSKIHIKPNSFVTSNHSPVSGQVSLEFKDIYDKSDMLLSDMPTMQRSGQGLVSAGEFFIRVKQGEQALTLDEGASLEVAQVPIQGNIENGMNPFIILPLIDPAFADTAGRNFWREQPFDTVKYTATGFVYSMYRFNAPASAGTWCNSDNPNYFANYPQAGFTIKSQEPIAEFGTELFLVFKNVNSMVHIYQDYQTANTFRYYYAPVGLGCYLVAVGVKDGKLYAYISPEITIPATGISTDFHLEETTTTAFKEALEKLNN